MNGDGISPWVYKGLPITSVDLIPEKSIGFVYQITNIISGKAYIGKKLFTKSKTRQVNKKKKRSRVESDWLTYFGSNQQLKNDVETLGHESFTRTILYFCASRGACSYMEAKVQIERGVLLCPDKWYNEWISVKVHRKHLKHPLTLEL